MTVEERISDLIRQSVSPRELHAFHPAEIVAAAERSRQRRRSQAATVAFSLAAVVVATTFLATRTSGTARKPGPENRHAPLAQLRPACAPPTVTASPATGRGELLASTTVGRNVAVHVVLSRTPGVRVLISRLIVGAPGTSAEVGDFAHLPATAALRPERQLARTTVRGLIPTGQRLSVGFAPARKGDYPVFFAATYATSPNCTGLPSPGAPTSTVVQPVGFLQAT